MISLLCKIKVGRIIHSSLLLMQRQNNFFDPLTPFIVICLPSAFLTLGSGFLTQDSYLHSGLPAMAGRQRFSQFLGFLRGQAYNGHLSFPPSLWQDAHSHHLAL